MMMPFHSPSVFSVGGERLQSQQVCTTEQQNSYIERLKVKSKAKDKTIKTLQQTLRARQLGKATLFVTGWRLCAWSRWSRWS